MTKPPAATFPTIYRDATCLYLEFPNYALRFPFSEGGLNKAIRHIPNIDSHPGYLTGRANVADRLLQSKAKIAKGTVRKRELAKFTDEQRRSAAGIVRKMEPK